MRSFKFFFAFLGKNEKSMIFHIVKKRMLPAHLAFLGLLSASSCSALVKHSVIHFDQQYPSVFSAKLLNQVY